MDIKLFVKMQEIPGVEQVGDKEFRIRDNRIFLVENNIIYIEAMGEQTDEIAEAHFELHNIICKSISHRLSYLINLNNAGKSSHRARMVWQEMSDLENAGKVALFGIHPVARLLATFVIGGKQYKNIRFFNTKEEAKSWLRE